MNRRTELGLLLPHAGTVCPLCGKTVRGRSFCSRCGRSRRLHVDPKGIREKRKEVYIPRQLIRQYQPHLRVLSSAAIENMRAKDL